MDQEQERAFQKLYDDLHGKGKGGRVYIWFDDKSRKDPHLLETGLGIGKRGYQVLSPKQKALGVCTQVPECMVKFSASAKSSEQALAAAAYIARHGKLALEDQDGNELSGKESLKAQISEWSMKDLSDSRCPGGAACYRVILSMPRGTPEKEFRAACRDWMKDSLDGYEYLAAFHLESNDKRTDHPHCHILLRAIGRDGKRFHVSNEERQALREHFAVCLRMHGIEANATRRSVRGRVQRSLGSAEYHQVRRKLSEAERRKAWAIDRKRKQLAAAAVCKPGSGAVVEKLEKKPLDIRKATRVYAATGQMPLLPIGLIKAKIRVNAASTTARRLATQFLSSEDVEDRRLGIKMRRFYSEVKPESRNEQTLRIVGRKIAERRRCAKEIRQLQVTKVHQTKDR